MTEALLMVVSQIGRGPIDSMSEELATVEAKELAREGSHGRYGIHQAGIPQHQPINV